MTAAIQSWLRAGSGAPTQPGGGGCRFHRSGGTVTLSPETPTWRLTGSKRHDGWDAVTEAEIVQHCRQGDRQGQRELYALTSDRIHGLLLRMTGDPDDAFDLAQETYLRAFDRIGQFDGGSSVATWLYRIAVNEALQFLRRRKRGEKALQVRKERAIRATTTDKTDAKLDVADAVADLPETERALVVLRYYQGLSYAEMARVLDKPPGTIASGLNRARALLQERLSGESA